MGCGVKNDIGLGLGKRPLLKLLLLVFSVVKKHGLFNIVVNKPKDILMSDYNMNGYIYENYNCNAGKEGSLRTFKGSE
jgi:hypothetical protein